MSRGRVLGELREAVIRLSLALLLCAAWLILGATLDGPDEVDAARASALAHQDAVAAARQQAGRAFALAAGTEP